MADTPSLQKFTLNDLEPFTAEKSFASNPSRDHHLFYVGRDDIHGILTYLHERVTRSLYGNMFGYDDEDLNAILMAKAADPLVTFLMTLDKSQAGGVHEKKILASDVAKDPAGFNAHFAIGTSATHQISHTKGGVLDGLVGYEGSTNWSSSGEGTIPLSGPRKAQNNTLMVFTDPDTLRTFTAELVNEHEVVVAQGGALAAPQPKAAA